MEIFKFLNPEHPTLLSQGQIINNIKTKLWIERYRDICEFELTANIEDMIHKLLPLGTLISHTRTSEVMIVENHEIIDDNEKETEVKITGRSFESIFEGRVVGSNKRWPTEASATDEYIIVPGYTWNQIVHLIIDHIYVSRVVDLHDAIPHITAWSDISGTGEQEWRVVKRGDLYTRLIELLIVDDLGIRTIRPGFNSLLGAHNPTLSILVHKGVDRSDEIIFSNITGEIESADYLWSNKNVKNYALVTGKWIEMAVKGAYIGYNRRMMHVEASDLDEMYSEAPTGTDRTRVLMAMMVRGNEALSAQKSVALIKTEASKNINLYKYRKDYFTGDLVTVTGQYNETEVMRVTEYVEIEDETGESGYPTLSII